MDEPGVLAEITTILGNSHISVEAFIQKQPKEGEKKVDIILLTQRVNEGDMNKALAQIEALTVTCSHVVKIRVETLK